MACAFDAMAEDYDEQFTASRIGRLMRDAVWARCAARFVPGSRVLEMNCGTGEDALWLARRGVSVLATDASAAMLQVAQRKLAVAPAADVSFRQLAWEELPALDEAPFDGVLSNFGGLNCVGDLEGTARALRPKLRPGAVLILCIMGPTVPWEWVWFLLRGDPSRAFRRLRRGGVPWSGMVVHYPSVGESRRAFAAGYRVLRVSALGAVLPPPYTEKWTCRLPRVIGALDRLERWMETRWPLPMLADHYLLELERT